jgi:hypothetical protein
MRVPLLSLFVFSYFRAFVIRIEKAGLKKSRRSVCAPGRSFPRYRRLCKGTNDETPSLHVVSVQPRRPGSPWQVGRTGERLRLGNWSQTLATTADRLCLKCAQSAAPLAVPGPLRTTHLSPSNAATWWQKIGYGTESSARRHGSILASR